MATSNIIVNAAHANRAGEKLAADRGFGILKEKETKRRPVQPALAKIKVDGRETRGTGASCDTRLRDLASGRPAVESRGTSWAPRLAAVSYARVDRRKRRFTALRPTPRHARCTRRFKLSCGSVVRGESDGRTRDSCSSAALALTTVPDMKGMHRFTRARTSPCACRGRRPCPPSGPGFRTNRGTGAARTPRRPTARSRRRG
jgi:hypothetical protein